MPSRLQSKTKIWIDNTEAVVYCADMTASYNIRYASGTTTSHTSIRAALESVSEHYPGCYMVDAGGSEITDMVGRCDIRSGRVVLVWGSEQESQDDDGSRAIAEIVTAD